MLFVLVILCLFSQISLAQHSSTEKGSKHANFSPQITLKILQQMSIENDLQKDQHWSQFSQFAERHSKIYRSKEEVHRRFLNYKHNLEDVVNQCIENEQGTAQYGETIFSDWSENEFFLKMGSWKQDENVTIRQFDEGELPNSTADALAIPISFDWRHRGVVTSVKNQGTRCASCWAFATAANVETQWAIAKGQLQSLSPQQLLDCNAVNDNCNGGSAVTEMRQVLRMGGLVKFSDYPYTAVKDRYCRVLNNPIVAYINDSARFPEDEAVMAQWVASTGTIVIVMDNYCLSSYRGGIVHPKVACGTRCDNWRHVVLIVGYGEEQGIPFWILKNSWGTAWGEQGYFKMRRGLNVNRMNQWAVTAIIH